MPELRLMTYNIFMGGRRGAPLHRLIRTVKPDVLLVNEAPKRPVLSKRDCVKLADKWGMEYVDGGRRAGSNMITRAPYVEPKWSDTEVLQTPRFQPRRGIAVAQLKVQGLLVGVISCHLSLTEEARQREVKHVLDWAARLRGPIVIGGDLNERPGSPAWHALRDAGFVDHGSKQWQTFPSDDPDARIDALLVRGAAQVTHHGDPGVDLELIGAASDHRPVLARIEL